MPRYDYQYQKCHAIFEVRGTFEEKGLKPECPQCHKQAR
jgi:putative FmdB family regulatory protein